MSVLDKIHHLTEGRPPLQERPIQVGDVTETFHFRRLKYGDSQRISTLPFSVDAVTGKPSFNMARVSERNAALVAASLCDEEGNSALSVAEVAELDADIAAMLHSAASEVNGLSDDAVEAALKNSDATGNAGSASN